MGCICGRFKSDGDEDGFVDLDTYNGSRDFLGRKSGKGQYYYGNGDIYDGQWDADKKHGYGIYTFANGEIMRGYFDRDTYVQKSHTDSAETLPHPSSITQEQLEWKEEARRRREEGQKQRELEKEKRRAIRENIRQKWLK